MKHDHLICLKIGGSVITDKSTLNTANNESIQEFAKNLAKVLNDKPDIDLLLGNGVGSFGHHTAHKYHLSEGASTPEQFYGAAITHNTVRQINLLLAKALTDKKLPVFSMSPGDMFYANDKKITEVNLNTLSSLLKNGLIPLLHGDVITDSARGVTVFSTETSLFWCAKNLREMYKKITVITIVNTDGVLDANDSIIPVLLPDVEVTILKTNAEHRDVTGGMLGKVASCRSATAWADAVYIVGNSARDISGAIHHQKVGTKIL